MERYRAMESMAQQTTADVGRRMQQPDYAACIKRT